MLVNKILLEILNTTPYVELGGDGADFALAWLDDDIDMYGQIIFNNESEKGSFLCGKMPRDDCDYVPETSVDNVGIDLIFIVWKSFFEKFIEESNKKG